jgi:hypothetical protein
MGPEQPDPQIAGSSERRGPPRTVPKELLKLWGLLPRRERQRRRRRFFHSAHAACCSRPVTDDSLASLNARVKILEEALAEFLHATAASIPVPTHPAKKRDREGAELPPAPTPANIVSETLPDIPPAAEAARNVVSPPPIISDSTSAAVPCDLHVYGLHGKESSDVVLDVPSANIGLSIPRIPVTPESVRTPSDEPRPGAAPHEATAHGAAPVPSDTDTNIFQRHAEEEDAFAESSTADIVADLVSQPRFHLHGIHSGWRAVTHSDSDSE